MDDSDVTERLLTDDNGINNNADKNVNDKEEVDKSKFEFIKNHSTKWSTYYSSYLFNNSLRGFFLIYFISGGTGFRWIIAANIFQTLVGDLITASLVSYYSDRMEHKVYGLGHRKYYLTMSLCFAVFGAIGLALGCNLDNSLRGIVYMVFSTIHYNGQAIMEIVRNPYLIENTSCQAEYVEVINYYTVPPAIIATLVAGGIFFVIHPIAAVACGIIFALFGFYKFKEIAEAPNPGDIQPDMLPAIRITLDNPVGWRLLTVYTLAEMAKAIDGLLVTVIQLNFNLIKRTSDLTYLMGAGAFIIVPVFVLGVYNHKKELDENGSDKYQMYIGVCWRFIYTYCIAFTLSASANYNENVVWLYLILGFFVLTYLSLYQGLTQNILLRDACMLDTMYTGIQRFSLYGMTLTRPPTFLGVVTVTIAFVLLRFTGYNELEDDTLDDRIDTRVEYTDETLWLLRCLTTIGPICCYSGILLILYSYPLDEIQSKRLEQLVDERKLKEEKEVLRKEQGKVIHGSGAKDDINIFSTCKFSNISSRNTVTNRKTFLEKGVQQAQMRLSTLYQLEMEEASPSSSIRASAPAYLNEEKITKNNCKFDAETITSMLHFSFSELHELSDPTKVTSMVLKNITWYNTINTYIPLITAAYMFMFKLYCFYIDDVDKVDIQALVLIVIGLVGLFHYLRKSPLKMLNSCHSDDARNLAVAGITARTESKEYLKSVLENLDHEARQQQQQQQEEQEEKETSIAMSTKKTSFIDTYQGSVSISAKRFQSWYQDEHKRNEGYSNHHNLNIITLVMITIASIFFFIFTFYFYISGHFW